MYGYMGFRVFDCLHFLVTSIIWLELNNLNCAIVMVLDLNFVVHDTKF